MKTYTLEELKEEFLSPEGLKKYEKELKEKVKRTSEKHKRFLLMIDVETTRSGGRVFYVLQEIEYDHPNCILAADPESAVDYCDIILGIDPRFIG